MNVVALLGNLGQDPEVRYTQSGKAVCNFSLAISEGRDKTTWVRCTAWEKTAELMGRYMTKGSKVAVEGRLTENNWTDKDGNERKSLEVSAFRVHFGAARDPNAPQKPSGYTGGGSAKHQPGAGGYGGTPNAPYADDEDIPF